MNNEDYFKYYIQGSDHYLIPKDIFDELFNELVNWREENKELQEKINKAIEYIKYCQTSDDDIFPVIEAEKMIEILKGEDYKEVE